MTAPDPIRPLADRRQQQMPAPVPAGTGSTYLVTGGAGFIGSHTVQALRARGDRVVVLDDLRQGHAEAVPADVPLVVADLADRARLAEVFSTWKIDAVLHFAALSLVGESMTDPIRYCRDNLANAMNLAEAAVAGGCRRFVLSSTAALFLPPEDGSPIADDAVPNPQNAYGESKYLIERALVWADKVHGLRTAALRYFNAAGCDPEGVLGEDHDPETHLIPIAIDAALGRRPPLAIFGTDYPTRDGTAIRDYIHVCDLASAHLAALDRLEVGSCRYNLGTGTGTTVQEVVAAVERVSGRKVPVRDAPRRAGDPAVLVARSDRFQIDTGWEPRMRRLDDLVATAWNWRQRHPDGYRSRPAAKLAAG
ncbi:UDP-glucose 4-epimerase [Humitalea rosea]|uniref:UDP-glucose 4-epimerase n=2 Tax=Humitalea rosea TaxID=990373 RepID=A0A2W7J924_9PROT|nr:UDP-glucose 4-epimerase [Humitalea rosea]